MPSVQFNVVVKDSYPFAPFVSKNNIFTRHDPGTEEKILRTAGGMLWVAC